MNTTTTPAPAPIWGRLTAAMDSCYIGEVFDEATDNAYWGGRCDAIRDLGYGQGFPSSGDVYALAVDTVEQLAACATHQAAWRDAEEWAAR